MTEPAESADLRTRRDKLRDMARQSASPQEAAIALRKLEAMAPPPPESLDARLDKLRDIVHGYSPGIRVRAIESEVLDNLYSDPVWDWDGTD